MKIYLFLQLAFVLFSFVFCSLEKKLGLDWFKKCLEEKSGIKRCIKYDFMSSMAFLKKQKCTASFSPICSDMNILVQCSFGAFGLEHLINGVNELGFVMDQIKNINHNIFNIFNCYYENYTFSLKDLIIDGFLYKIFNESSAEQVFYEHSEWVKKESLGLLNTPFNVSFFKELGRLYASYTYFKDDWAKIFNSTASCNRAFKLASGHLISRKFMRKVCFFKYEKVNYNQIEYQIVAIPFKEEKKSFTRYMVYLIPLDYNTDLFKLWDTFYIFSKGRIKSLITKLNMEEIDLNVPILNDLRSKFDLKEILEDVFKYTITQNCYSTIVTYINIDENDSNLDVILTSLISMNSCSEIPYVIADRPHISFIFDMQSKRILFITKDIGLIKTDN